MSNAIPPGKRWHLAALEAGISNSLVAEEEHGVVVLYIATVRQCAVPLTRRVREWLRALLDELNTA